MLRWKDLTDIRLVDILCPIRKECVGDNQQVQLQNEPFLFFGIGIRKPLQVVPLPSLLEDGHLLQDFSSETNNENAKQKFRARTQLP